VTPIRTIVHFISIFLINVITLNAQRGEQTLSMDLPDDAITYAKATMLIC
jgi:hypothetical protein